MADVGVILRTRNRPILLERALRSILNQSFSDWELIVVNDGGNPEVVDQAIEHLPAATRGKVRIVHLEEPLGRGSATNTGLHELTTRFVHVHDDGDSLRPQFLEKTVNYLRNPPHASVKGVVAGTELVIERLNGDTLERISSAHYNDWLQHISLRRILADNVFAPIAFLFDREAALKAGGFDEKLPVLCDWEFNVRFLSQFEIAIIPDLLAHLHRIEGMDAEAEMAEETRQKLFFDNLLRNEWLRADIASGRTGPGVIANEARMLRNLTRKFKKRSLRLFKKK